MRASDLGVSIQTISATANVLVGGEPVTKYKEFDEQYDVWLRAEQGYRNDADAIGVLTLPSTNAKIGHVQLASVARLEDAQGPNTIDRFGRQRQVGISANLEGIPLGAGVQRLSDYMKTLDLPPDYRFEFLGKAKTLEESNSAFAVIFGLSFLFMYMVLALHSVREFRASDHDFAGAAADGAVCHAVANLPADRSRHLRGLRAVHAVRHREEERHSAD